MGSKKKAEPTTVFQTPDTTAIQQNYQQSLAAVQAQSQQSLAAVQEANRKSQEAIQQQLQQQQQANAAQQDSLNKYLAELQKSQIEQQQAIAARDTAVAQQQEFEKNTLTGQASQTNLLASTQVANSKFKESTSRKRGFIA